MFPSLTIITLFWPISIVQVLILWQELENYSW